MTNLPATTLTAPTLGESIDWNLPRDLVDTYLAGRLVFVPRELYEMVEAPFPRMRIEKRETIYLVWSAIRSTPTQARSNWRRVHSKLIYRNGGQTPKNALCWLIENGFVDIPEGKNPYCVGKFPKKYKIIDKANPIPVELENKNALDGVIRTTANEPTCEYARNCLDRIEADRDVLANHLQAAVRACEEVEKKRKEKKKSKGKMTHKPSKPEDMLYTLGGPLLQLYHRKGRVLRGQKGNRLYSPMTRLKSEFREGFSYGGEPMAMIDMQCAQPCLLGNLARDYTLIEDCLSDEFYAGIMDSLNVSRKKAKKAYCTFAYDEYRPGTPVGAYVRARYPRAAAYMASQKQEDFRHFSHVMQRAEAEIFVDGVYPRMKAAGIDGLTIHDAIFCRESDANEVEEMAAEEMAHKNITAKIARE